MKAPTRYDALLASVKALVDAERASKAACDRRGAMPPGSTRARTTTANANWARAAEHRDRCQDSVAHAVLDAGILSSTFLATLAFEPHDCPDERADLRVLPDLSRTGDEQVRMLIDHGISAAVREHAKAELGRRTR